MIQETLRQVQHETAKRRGAKAISLRNLASHFSLNHLPNLNRCVSFRGLQLICAMEVNLHSHVRLAWLFRWNANFHREPAHSIRPRRQFASPLVHRDNCVGDGKTGGAIDQPTDHGDCGTWQPTCNRCAKNRRVLRLQADFPEPGD